jgi:hypothetical protein
MVEIKDSTCSEGYKFENIGELRILVERDRKYKSSKFRVIILQG